MCAPSFPRWRWTGSARRSGTSAEPCAAPGVARARTSLCEAATACAARGGVAGGEGVDAVVSGQITEAIGQWADEIAALGGGEPLTRFRDAKVGTLDLSAADDSQRRALMDGVPVRVSRLFPHDPLRTTAARSARRLADRLWRLEAAHGIAAGYLATGLASWSHPTSTRRPNVPILLRRLLVEQIGFGEPDLMLHVVGEPELNPHLLDEMADQLGLRLTVTDLVGPAGELRYPVVVDRLREQAPPHVVDGFTVSHRAVIGLMCDAALTVANDLTADAVEFSRRPLVALAAGASPSRGQPPSPAATERSGEPPIDLDERQQRVLDVVRTGASVAVEAPAGTGATQVAAALCADAVAAGKSVLVVAEASPRLRGLRRRLAAIGLGGATLDLADGLISPAGLARDVISTIDTAARRARTDGAAPGDDPSTTSTEDDARLLADYVAALHEHRPPRTMSAYHAISAAHAVPADQIADVRLGPDVLAGLDAPTLDRLRRALTDFVDRDGLRISAEATPWFGASPSTDEEAEAALASVERLRSDLLPAARDRGARAAVEVGMASPSTVADLESLADVLSQVSEVESVFTSDVWAAPVQRMAVALADRRSRRESADAPGMRERLGLRKQAMALLRPGVEDEAAAAAMAQAAAVSRRWNELARDGRRPRVGASSAEAIAAWRSVTDELASLRGIHPEAVPAELDLAGTAARLASLAADADWARRLPRLSSAAAELADAGLGPLVAELRARREAGGSITSEQAVAVLDTSVAASVADEILSNDPVLAGVDADRLAEVSSRWRQADAARAVAAAGIAHTSWAGAAASAATERPVQVRALRDAVGGRSLATTRDLVASAWQTMVKARPVWLAGPLPAAAALPVDVAFDLVVVLDAHGVALAHAVGVLARAHQVVVLADSAQLPPSPTPLTLDAPDHRSIQATGSAPETPSVYAVLRDQLPTVDLEVRHGCRDGRLAVVAPARRDEREPAVPPGSAATSPVSFHHTPQEPGSRDQEESVDAEVSAVVELVRGHVHGQPGQSLAVLTLGRVHADAIEAALARASRDDDTLAAALGPIEEEPFVLCPVEDLTGERRDTVILSVGFGRTMDGRLLYRYGPLNRPGGVRWLAAAVSTARRSLAVVSSVTASDLEPRRLAADGLRALQHLLASAEGLALDDLPDPRTHPAVAPRALDAFERAVAEHLHDAGLPVIAGSGTGELATAMGLAHPGRPHRGVLVVETEGGVFASLPRLRDRERLRPEQLMRAGWQVHRVCTTAWAKDPAAEVARLRSAWEKACAQADALDAAANTPTGASEPSAPTGGSAQPGPRPHVVAGRPADSYPPPDLTEMAAWIEAAWPGLSEDDRVDRLARELDLGHPTGRVDRVLRRAVAAVAIDDAAHRALGAQAVAAQGAEPLVVADPLPLLSGRDEQERTAEREGEDDERDRWLNDERPPHH